jgi:hypothetical protein
MSKAAVPAMSPANPTPLKADGSWQQVVGGKQMLCTLTRDS